MAESRCSWLHLLAALCLCSGMSSAIKNCDFSSKVNLTLQQIVLTCQCPSGPSLHVHLVSIPDPPANARRLMQLTPASDSPPPPQSPWMDQRTFHYSVNLDSLALSEKQSFVCVTEGMDQNHYTVDDRYSLFVSLLDLYPMPSTTTETTSTTTTTTTSLPPTSESTTVQQPTTAEAGNSSTDGTVTTSSAAASRVLSASAAAAATTVRSIPSSVRPRDPGHLLGDTDTDSQVGENVLEKKVLGISVKMWIVGGVSVVLFILVIALIYKVLANHRRARQSKHLPPLCGRQANSNDVQLDVVLHRLLTHLTSPDHRHVTATSPNHGGHGIPPLPDRRKHWVRTRPDYRLSGSSAETVYDCADGNGGISPTGSTYAICDGPTKARLTLDNRAEAAAKLCEMRGGHQIHFEDDVHQMSHFGDCGGCRVHVENELHQVSHLDELIRHQWRGHHSESEVQEDSHYDEVEEDSHYDDLKEERLYDDLKEVRLYDDVK